MFHSINKCSTSSTNIPQNHVLVIGLLHLHFTIVFPGTIGKVKDYLQLGRDKQPGKQQPRITYISEQKDIPAVESQGLPLSVTALKKKVSRQ